MATRLKSIVRFVNVAPGATVALPHGLRDVDDAPTIPDHVEGDASGFVVTADVTDVTVTNTGPGAASINVFVEAWHTIERAFGPAADLNLIPKPFIMTPSGSGGGNPINVEDEGVLVGVRPTLNFIGAGVAAVDNPPDNRVDVTISAAVVGATVPTQIDVGDAGLAGVSAQAARADHQHALPAPAAPANVTKAAASAGAATTVARADHKHDVDTAAPVATAQANAEGTATSLARSDHVHRTIVQVQDEGILTSSRPIIDFVGAGVSVADDNPGDRAVVTIPGGAQSAIIGFGSGNIATAADTRFLTPWFDAPTGLSAEGTIIDLPAPRSGVLRNLYVRHNRTVGNGNSVVYTVMLNGVATLLTVTLATGAIGQLADLVNTVAVVQGDRIGMRAVKALSIGNGALVVAASMELT